MTNISCNLLPNIKLHSLGRNHFDLHIKYMKQLVREKSTAGIRVYLIIDFVVPSTWSVIGRLFVYGRQ